MGEVEPSDRFEMVDGDEVADRAGSDQVEDATRVRRVAQHVAHAEEDAGRRGSGDGGGAVLLGASQRLLAEDVVAGGGEGLDRRPMVAVLCCDDHRVGDAVGGDEVVPVGERCAGGEAEQPGDPIAVQRARFGDLDHLGLTAMCGGHRLGIDRTAAAEADDGEAQRPLEWPPEVIRQIRRRRGEHAVTLRRITWRASPPST